MLKNPSMDFSSESNFTKRRKWTSFLFYRFSCIVFSEARTHIAAMIEIRWFYMVLQFVCFAIKFIYRAVNSFFSAVSRALEVNGAQRVYLLLQFGKHPCDASWFIYNEYTHTYTYTYISVEFPNKQIGWKKTTAMTISATIKERKDSEDPSLERQYRSRRWHKTTQDLQFGG